MWKSLNNLHHANLLVGGKEVAEKALHSFFESEGIKLIGSPDFFVYREPLFGIDEARQLSNSASRKSFTGKKVFLILPERITLEAQNALLKTFEDPTPNTHFFLVISDAELILPTLRSRMETVRLDRAVFENDAEKFLKLNINERLKFVKKFVDNERNLSVFLDQLLSISRSREVYDVRNFSDDRSASSRLILEHLSLVL